MDMARINPWLSLAANIGVIAGLVLVALQINQNTEITKAQIANDYFLADMNLELAMMGEDPASSWVKAVYSPDEITQYDAAILDRYFNYGVVQILRLEEMHELGLAPDDWQERVDYLSWHLGNEVGRRWWEYSKGDWPEDVAQRVDNRLERSNYSGNQDLLDSILPTKNGGAE
jgi:hypothetical protein